MSGRRVGSEMWIRGSTATARGLVRMAPETLATIKEGRVKKGDPLTVAQLAGIMGAKRTPDLIPLCHPLALTSVKVFLRLDDVISGVRFEDLSILPTGCGRRTTRGRYRRPPLHY